MVQLSWPTHGAHVFGRGDQLMPITWENAVDVNGQSFDVVAKYGRTWSCRVHDAPRWPDYDDDGEEVTFDFPVYGCSCDSARWETNYDEIVFVLDGGMSKILRAYYVPAITEMLNNEILLKGLIEIRSDRPD